MLSGFGVWGGSRCKVAILCGTKLKIYAAQIAILRCGTELNDGLFTKAKNHLYKVAPHSAHILFESGPFPTRYLLLMGNKWSLRNALRCNAALLSVLKFSFMSTETVNSS